ncbi:hypothetical protein [Actinomadura sp. CNU-125]|uniref:hypothetical protein n=1 Tax=Actinomadura sp. CNU-125 TaxID=1904961 RepID=UPI0021CCA9C0|nr:hypothetical protein [Actinomadura sp. CNU-125]
MIVSIEDLADGAAGAPLLDPDGAPCDPLVAVDLSGGTPAARGRAARAALDEIASSSGWATPPTSRARST